MSLPKYAEYKDSGVAWLGEVPAHWQVTPVKRVANIVNGYPFDSNLFDSSIGMPLVRIRDLNKKTTEALYKGERIEAAVITSADMLVGMDGDFNVGRWLGDGAALLNQRMCCVRGRSEQVSRLLEYALPTPLRLINDLTYSTTVKHLASSQIEKTRVALPQGERELESILAFLDRETGKIDALIAEQEKLLTLLAEKRQATISHAVTRGLNPNAPMKDSGVPWLGEVPAHWEVIRLKRATSQITVGIVVEPSKYYVDDGVPALRSLNVSPGEITRENMVYISDESNDSLAKSQLRSGDIVAVRSGQTGVAAVVPPELDGCNCIDLIIIRKPEQGCERFLCWYLASDAALYQFEGGSDGAIQKHFNIGTAMNLLVAWPSEIEQRGIASFLDDELGKLDCLVTSTLRAITLLKERRSALIAAGVTGKIDVRGEV